MEEGTLDAGITAGDTKMVTVRVSETYDLSTKLNRMGIVGIHTPRGNLIDQMWPGLVMQYKKFRFVSCDVTMACASMLPADPLQIGVEAGAIAPQDMFNPILYRAVSNDAMSNLQALLHQSGFDASSKLVKGSIVDVNSTAFDENAGGEGSHDIDQFSMYYGLLADDDNWRKAMPQAGLQMLGLYPLVYQVVSQFGSNSPVDPRAEDTSINDLGNVPTPRFDMNQVLEVDAVNFRGPSMRMPAIDTTFFVEPDNVKADIVTGYGNTKPNALINSNTGRVPPAYVAMLVLPPAKLNQLYYRMKVTWTIEFTGLRAMSDFGSWMMMNFIGQSAYGTDYDSQASTMSVKTAMVDAEGADVIKIMEGA